MSNIIIPISPEVNGEVGKIISQEGELLRSISACMNSMRALKLIPDWYHFSHTDAWWEMSRQWTSRQKTKYEAWWSAIYHLQRDKSDKATVGLIIAYCLQEKVRRNHNHTPTVFPQKLGITDDLHALRVQEYVRSKYEALDPELGIGA